MLITEEYRSLNADLHRRKVFGQRGDRHAGVVLQLLEEYGPGAVLDYGCGRARLAAALKPHKVDVISYDPAIERYAADPPACHVVVCTDVLEHVEPDCLDAVLRHLARCTGTVAHIVIATKLDGHKKLADGRDPHLIVRPTEWWRSRLGLVYGRVRLLETTPRDCTFRAYPL